MRCVRRVYAFFALLSLVLALGLPACGQVDVLMRHNDQGQTGANNAETILTPAKVATPAYGFARSFALRIVGDLYAQVLIFSGAGISGHRNVGLAATGHNMVYAFDADTGVEIWCVSLGNPVPQQPNDDIPYEIGVVGTPVVDASTKTVYVVAKTFENGKSVLRLHALDIANHGAEKFGAPIEIYAFAPGNGDDSSNGEIFFNPLRENQRPGLKLFNGNLYIAFASHEDHTPYHGWVLAYDAHNLRPDPLNLNQLPKAVFNTTPNAGGGGIWMSGQAPVIDNSGNVYALTGNLILVDPTTDCPIPNQNQPAGNVNSESDPTTFGESYIKLKGDNQLPGTHLAALDFFKPPNAHSLDCTDSDVSSGGAMEIPGSGYIVGGGKDGRLFVINENSMGGYHPTAPPPDDPGRVFDVQGGHIFSSPVWFDSLQRMYLWGSGTVLKAWNWDPTNGRFLDTANPLVSHASNPPTTPNAYSANAELAVSSNGGAPNTRIVWALVPTTNPNDSTSGGVGNLYAFDADSLDVLYHDFYDNYAKYNVPTVANGKVYVPTFTYDKTNRLGYIFAYGFPSKHRAVRHLSDSAMAQQTYTFATVDSSDPNLEIPVNLNFAGDLAPGMSFFGSTGVLTGAPATPGVFDFTVTANYSDGTQLPQEYALSVCQSDPASPNIAVNIPINSSYVIGTINSNLSRIYSFDLVSGGLPPGMVLDRNTGMVSGAPTVAGTYNPRIRSTRLQDPNVSLFSCAAGTTSDLFYQISVTCPGGQCQFEGYH
ncbi:MAG TPA: Ig domain-containing protein, partial [Candidatus Angelobacter sp.]|nr:Ig domain-containing protein [Candidatus Angelobacter sp.]